MGSKFAKLAFAALVGMSLLGLDAKAQATTGAGQRPTQSGQTNSQLTADQKAKMKELRKNEHDQIAAVRKDTSLTQEQKREKIRDINRSFDTQMKGILTPQQYQRLHRRGHNRRPNHQGARKQGRNGNRQGQRRPPVS